MRAILLLAWLTAWAAWADGLQPAGLRCEDQINPLGVDAAQPRLGWALEARERGARQTAYQVLVATHLARLNLDQGDAWDSGRVASSEQNHIAYAGQPLRANQDYFWKIRAWNERGIPGAWSPPARWTAGLLRAADWQARWITAANPASPAPLPLFRKPFAVAKPVRRALVHICGLGHFDLFVDGTKVGDHFLDPAWSAWEKTAYYNTFDVTAALARGPHVLGVMLGKGFYNTAGDRRVHGVNASRPLKLILQAHLFFADGTEQVIVSDASWRTAPGPITHSAILAGEDFDARRVPTGWDGDGFDDSTWAAAREAEGPGGQVAAALSPPLTFHDTFQPVRVDEPKPGVFVYDFGQNAAAIPHLRVRGQAGQSLKLTPAEQRHGMSPRRNDGRGLVNPAGVGSPNYFSYTLRGGEPETWQPQFTYTGFQYLQLEGAVPAGRPNPNQLPVVEALVSRHVRNTAPAVGHFECSLPLFNRIDGIIDWAVRANLSHVLTDCPHREKLGWLEVAYLMGPSLAGRYDVSRFYRKIARDCAEAQSPAGLVPTVAPAYPAFSGGFAYTPEWGAAAVVVPAQLYDWYGDRGQLAEHYPAMRGFVDFLHATARDLVPKAGLGDWYDYGHGKPVGPAQFTPPELSAMVTFHRCARLVADAAGRLGKRDEARRYQNLTEEIARAFNARYYDGKGQYQNLGSPQTANSMALTEGLVPAGQEPAVLGWIEDDLRRRGHQQTAGDIGHWYLLQALAQAGRHGLLYDVAARTNLGSYGFIVNQGWTSLPEAWDANTGASMNHCMLGHIQEWFMGNLAGLRPDPAAPGQAFIIAPQPVGEVTWAKASYQSARGLVSVHWERKETRRLLLRLVLPPNTTATVRLPAAAGATLTEGGLALDQAPGITRLKQLKDEVEFQAAGGSYAFESAPAPNY